MKPSRSTIKPLGYVHQPKLFQRKEAHGFTVLELIIALVILGFGLSALSGATADSLMRTTRADMDAKASRAAEGLLARLGATIPIREGISAGRLDDMDWTMAIGPYGSDEDRSAWPLKPEAIALTLSWRQAGVYKSATWRTVRAMPVPSATQ